MAKISSYPSDANVTTSDRLIGSDNENSNETKNFEVGDIITLAASIIGPNFVPYTGATGNVDLGNNSLDADVINAGDVYANNLFNLGGNPNIFIGNDALQPVGLLIDTSTKFFGLGDIYSQFNGTKITIEDGSSRISFVGGFNLSNGQGTAGQVLTSAGAGTTPTWTSLSANFVPYTGATGNVDLGNFDLIADNVQADIFQLNSGGILGLYGTLQLNGSPGTAGQVLTSSGGGVPTWTSLSGTYVPYTGATTGVNLGIYSMTAANVNANNFVPIVGGSGNTFFGGAGGYGVARNGVYALGTDITILGDSTPGTSTYIQIDAPNTNIAFLNGYVSLSGTSGLFLINGFGTAGQVLESLGAGNAPQWVDVNTLITSNLYKGNFYDSITQTLAAANTATPVILRNTDAPTTNGISIVTDGTNLSRITFANAGVYNILFSAQLANSGGTAQTVDFWLRKNGSTAAANIAHTNGKVQLQGNASFLMAAWNYFVDVAAGDYIQLVWAATSTNITMVAAAANGVHPETPSIIVTANVV
jgi:hypothetical protein